MLPDTGWGVVARFRDLGRELFLRIQGNVVFPVFVEPRKDTGDFNFYFENDFRDDVIQEEKTKEIVSFLNSSRERYGQWSVVSGLHRDIAVYFPPQLVGSQVLREFLAISGIVDLLPILISLHQNGREIEEQERENKFNRILSFCGPLIPGRHLFTRYNAIIDANSGIMMERVFGSDNITPLYLKEFLKKIGALQDNFSVLDSLADDCIIARQMAHDYAKKVAQALL
jgi:hypothetical protein